MSSTQQKDTPPYLQEARSAIAALGSDAHPVSEQEAEERLEQHGIGLTSSFGIAGRMRRVHGVGQSLQKGVMPLHGVYRSPAKPTP